MARILNNTSTTLRECPSAKVVIWSDIHPAFYQLRINDIILFFRISVCCPWVNYSTYIEASSNKEWEYQRNIELECEYRSNIKLESKYWCNIKNKWNKSYIAPIFWKQLFQDKGCISWHQRFMICDSKLVPNFSSLAWIKRPH